MGETRHAVRPHSDAVFDWMWRSNRGHKASDGWRFFYACETWPNGCDDVIGSCPSPRASTLFQQSAQIAAVLFDALAHRMSATTSATGTNSRKPWLTTRGNKVCSSLLVRGQKSNRSAWRGEGGARSECARTVCVVAPERCGTCPVGNDAATDPARLYRPTHDVSADRALRGARRCFPFGNH